MPLEQAPTVMEYVHYTFLKGDSDYFDSNIVLLNTLDDMVTSARSMADKFAVSWRNVKFGSTALVNSTANENLGIAFGYNYSPESNSSHKYCAEMRADGNGRSSGYERLDAVVLAGTTDPETLESIYHYATPTAEPCDPCLDSVVRDSTVFLSVGQDVDTMEAHTGAEMKKIRALNTQALTKKGARKVKVPERFPVHYKAGVIAGKLAVYQAKLEVIEFETEEERQQKFAEAFVETVRESFEPITA
jgi:hypothetical protein